MTQLKQLQIVPLADGQLVKLEGKTVFFPIHDEKNKKTKKHREYLISFLYFIKAPIRKKYMYSFEWLQI